MKTVSTLPILLLSLLSCLSLAFCSPIPARGISSDDLVQRSTDYSSLEARSSIGQGDDFILEKRMFSALRTAGRAAVAGVRLKSSIAGPSSAAPPSAGPRVTLSQKTNHLISGQAHYPDGKSPSQAHVDTVKSHFANQPHVDHVKVIAPFHKGGKGDKKRGPDTSNHSTVQPYSKGKPLPKQHVPAPAGYPAVKQKQFKQFKASVGKTKVQMPKLSAKAKAAAKKAPKAPKAATPAKGGKGKTK